MHKRLWIVAGLLVGVLAVGACKKSTTTSPETQTPVNQIFSVNGGQFQSAAFPSPSGDGQSQPQIASVTGNGVVIPGGNAPLSIQATDPQNDLQQVLVGANGYSGYFVVSWPAQQNTFQITLLFPPSLNVDSFVIILAVQDAQGNISAVFQIPVQRVAVGTGKLQVSLAWDLLNDIDLHLVQPDSQEIFYGNPQSTQGGFLDLDSNPGCSIDSVNNENITYPDTATVVAGTYTVRVDFYADCVGNDTTHYVVTARWNGQLVNTLSGANPANGIFPAGTDDAGGMGSGVTVMTFTIPQNATGYLLKLSRPARPLSTKKALRR